MFSIIAAIGKNNEIGKKGQLIFHIKDDMAFFRKTTLNHPVVMGSNTWNSLPGKLKNRENIVISHKKITGPDQVIENVEDYIKQHQNTPEELFIIGGGSIYTKFLPYAKNLYLTEIDATADDADTFFPNFNKSNYHQTLIRKGSENGLNYSIVKYVKQ